MKYSGLPGTCGAPPGQEPIDLLQLAPLKTVCAAQRGTHTALRLSCIFPLRAECPGCPGIGRIEPLRRAHMKHAAAHSLYDALDAVAQMATAPLARDDNQASVVHPSAQSLGRHADVTETGGRGVRAGGLEVDGVSIGNPADTLAAGSPAKLIALPSPSLRTLFGLSASH